jgi:hypothetical protein
MVVRRRYARLVVDVCKNLETERRIFVKDLQPARNVVAAEFLDEILVGEQAFEILTDLFASRRAGIARKSGTAIADELVEVMASLQACSDIVSRKSKLNARRPSLKMREGVPGAGP